LNNLGWLLATCSDASFREPGQALSAARRAVAITPDEGTYWNTLGVTHYRAGEWDEAMKAFDRSMQLRGQGDSYDWYFVAMIQARKGQATEARGWYDKAAAWNEERAPVDEELYRFRVEAAELLGLPRPPRPAQISRDRVMEDSRFLPEPFTRRNRGGSYPGAAVPPLNPTVN
jgi:tetratricopeptide (TPR) repeat protein